MANAIFLADITGPMGPVGDWYKGVIPNGSNLNDYTGTSKTGLYAILGQSDAETISNLPEKFAGSVLVLPVGGGASQEYTPYYWPARKWIRNSAPSTGTGWTSWRKVSMGGDLKHEDVAAGTDLNDIYGDGMEGTHPVLLSSIAATLKSLPPELEKEPRAFVLFAKTLGNGTIQEIDTYYWPARKYVRNSAPSTGNGWTAWKSILMEGDISSGGGGGASNGFKSVPLSVTLPASSSTTETISAASLRFPLKYGAPVHRGALHIQNKNFRGDITYTGAVSFTGVWFGEGSHTTGAFTSAPAQVHGAFTTPANGDAKILPWSNLLAMEPYKEYLLSVGYTTAAGQANTLSVGAVWRSTTPGNASALAPSHTKGKNAPFNFWIEAETFGDTPVIATVASSGGAGSGTTLPILDSSVSIIARREGGLPVHYAHAGSTLAIWDEADHIKWQQWATMARPDAVILALGSNDVFGSSTLAEIQASFLDVAKIITDTQTPNLFLTTIPPRSFAGDDAKRLAFNAWMKTLPGGAKDIFDYSAILTGPDGLLNPIYDADGTHANTLGAEAVASMVNRPIVGHLTGTDTGPRSVATIPALPAANTGNRGLIIFVVSENKPLYSNGTAWASVTEGARGLPGPPGPGVPTGGAAMEVLRMNSAGTTTEWVKVTPSSIGLGQVDNTTDAQKPVSGPQWDVLDTKASIGPDGKVVASQLPAPLLTEDPAEPGFYLIGG
ncbi:hypothetical protein CGQ24_08170 [Arthrobacter sp. 7749]|nr:hypothetical protein CGQ24_08170 [Arthrobacter sp. 7749]